MPTPTPAHRAAPSALLSVTTGTCTGVASTSAMICGQRLPFAAPPVKTVLPGGDTVLPGDTPDPDGPGPPRLPSPPAHLPAALAAGPAFPPPRPLTSARIAPRP